jgi:transposase
VITNGILLDVIEYAHNNGYTYKEIAERLGVGLQTLRNFKDTKYLTKATEISILEKLQRDGKKVDGLKFYFPKKHKPIQLSRNQTQVIITRWFLTRKRDWLKLCNLLNTISKEYPSEYDLAVYNFSLWKKYKMEKRDLSKLPIGFPVFFINYISPAEEIEMIEIEQPKEVKKSLYQKFLKKEAK